MAQEALQNAARAESSRRRRRWRASLAGVAGGRRWRASLMGVAGGRRWLSHTKIPGNPITPTKTPHTPTHPHDAKHAQRTSSGGSTCVINSRVQIKTPAIPHHRASPSEANEGSGASEQRDDSTTEPCQQTRTNTAADRPPDAKELPRANFILLETTGNANQPDEGE